MAKFEDKTEDMLLRYKHKVTVFLESNEDLHIFKEIWFHEELEFIEFKSADCGDGGGCKMVLKCVDETINKGLVAFGIVDRDSLMKDKHWDVFLEEDDSVFRNLNPFGNKIKVLLKWELENYLLNPEIFETILSDNCRRTVRQPNEVYDEFLKHCDFLIPVTAANILYKANNHRTLDNKYGTHLTKRDDVTLKIRENEKMGALEPSFNEIVLLLDEIINKHDEFAEKWNSITRFIDGKSLYFKIMISNGLRDERRYELARLIKERNMVNSDIREYVDFFKRSYN